METPKNHKKTHSNEGILTKHVLQTCRALPAHQFFFVAPDLQSVCVCLCVCVRVGGWSSFLSMEHKHMSFIGTISGCKPPISGYSDIFTAHKRQFQDNVCKPHPVALASDHERHYFQSPVVWIMVYHHSHHWTCGYLVVNLPILR